MKEKDQAISALDEKNKALHDQVKVIEEIKDKIQS
jgi:hypothetical protein